MKCLKALGLAVAVAMALLAFFGACTASATILTSPAGTQAPAGTKIVATLEGSAVWWTGLKSVTCTEGTIEAEVTNVGGATETVKGNVTRVAFGNNCNCEKVEVTQGGTLELHPENTGTAGNGTLTSNGATTITTCGGVTCRYITENSHIGTLTGSINTGGTASIDINAILIKESPSNFLCTSTSELIARYKVTTPDYVDVDGTLVGGTTLTSPAGTHAPAGTEINASLEASSVLRTSLKDVTCTEGTVKGKVTNAGSASEAVSASVESSSFGNCNCEKVEVTQGGTLKIHTQNNGTTSNGNGTLTSNGTTLVITCSGVRCRYVTENTDTGTLTGSVNTEGTATIDVNTNIIKEATSSFLCASSAKWEALYKVTTPDYLDVD